MLVYIYQAALLCQDCGEQVRQDLTAQDRAPQDPEDEGGYDSGDFPKGPQEEGDSDAPSHCDACGCFLESDLTSDGADYVLETAERVLRGEERCGEALAEWIQHYERRDDRISLAALVGSGLTIGEILSALQAKDAEIQRLSGLAGDKRAAA